MLYMTEYFFKDGIRSDRRADNYMLTFCYWPSENLFRVTFYLLILYNLKNEIICYTKHDYYFFVILNILKGLLKKKVN